jgi:disulfide bond formation protein DsbB
MKTSFRTLCFLGLLACAAAMGFALYLQYYQGFEPCPMCIFQRMAMIGAGAFFLLGFLHGPRAGGQWFYSLFAALAAVAGVLVASRHVWLQAHPDQAASCSGSLDFLVGIYGWLDAAKTVLKGEADCAKIDAQFLGLSLPLWTLLTFIALTLYALMMPKLARRRSPNELQ